jgi:hypothetical protein
MRFAEAQKVEAKAMKLFVKLRRRREIQQSLIEKARQDITLKRKKKRRSPQGGDNSGNRGLRRQMKGSSYGGIYRRIAPLHHDMFGGFVVRE